MYGNHNHFHDNCQLNEDQRGPDSTAFSSENLVALPPAFFFLYFLEFDYLDVSYYSRFWTQKLALILC